MTKYDIPDMETIITKSKDTLELNVDNYSLDNHIIYTFRRIKTRN